MNRTTTRRHYLIQRVVLWSMTRPAICGLTKEVLRLHQPNTHSYPSPTPPTTTFIEDKSNGFYFYKAYEILGEPPTQLGYKPLPRSPSPGCAHSISTLFSFGLRLLCFHVFALNFIFIFSKALSRTDGFSRKKDKPNPIRTRLPFSCFLHFTISNIIYTYLSYYWLSVFDWVPECFA